MTEDVILKFLHIVLFVYWLGPDWGVYVISSRIWQAELTVAERRRWAATVVSLSRISRNSLILLIPVGLHLSYEIGVTVLPASIVAAVWLFAFFWVAVSLVMNAKRGTRVGAVAASWDQGIRYAAIPILLAIGAASIAIESPFTQTWIGIKLCLFAFLLFNSIQQRRVALLWVGALALVDAASNDADRVAAESIITRTASRAKFNAYLTWAATLAIAFFGVSKLI